MNQAANDSETMTLGEVKTWLVSEMKSILTDYAIKLHNNGASNDEVEKAVVDLAETRLAPWVVSTMARLHAKAERAAATVH